MPKTLPQSRLHRLPIFSVLLGIIALLFSFWLMFHTFSYNTKTHEITIAFKLWSDFGAHIPLIRSFSMGDNLTRIAGGTMPEYPVFPGEPIRYHFLFYLFVGLLEKLGMRIDWALNIPSALGFFFLILLIYRLSMTLFGSRTVAVLSIVFFLFNGSLGILRLLSLFPLSADTFRDIVTVKQFPAFAPWGPGEVTAFWNLNIYTNQRHLAVGFALVFLIIACLRLERLPFKKQAPWAILWGLAFGILPFFHQPALLIAAIVMASYMIVFPRLRLFLLVTGLITTALVIPQLILTAGSQSPVQWYPGYTIHNELFAQKQLLVKLWHMTTYWWQNLGIHSILIPVGFFLIPGRARRILLPVIPLFIIPNLFKFSVEASANHKFFNFVMLLGQMISAYVVVHVGRMRLSTKSQWVSRILFAGRSIALTGLTGLLVFTGIIDFFVILNDTRGGVLDIPKNEVAAWIAHNTPKNAIFLNSSFLYHPASLAGRSIVLGWPYFAWSAGYKENRGPVMDAMYDLTDHKKQCELFAKYRISYITVEDVKGDPNLPAISMSSFLKLYKPVFITSGNRYAIFTRAELCK